MRRIIKKDQLHSLKKPYKIIRILKSGWVIVETSEDKGLKDRKFKVKQFKVDPIIELFPNNYMFPTELQNKINVVKHLNEAQILKNVRIGVIDSGVNDHKLFELENVEIDKYSVFGDDGSDQYGHGTHVIGIISMVSPYSNIISYKIINENGEGSFSDLLIALDDMIDLGVDVVNLSLGGDPGDLKTALDDQIKEMIGRGVTIVVASGNEGWKDKVSYPCSNPYVICVGSVNKYDQVMWYTNIDPNNKKPEFFSYGENILSCDKDDPEKLVSMSGTSQATGVVTGVVSWIIAWIKEGLYTKTSIPEQLPPPPPSYSPGYPPPPIYIRSYSGVRIDPIAIKNTLRMYTVKPNQPFWIKLLRIFPIETIWDEYYGYGIPILP